MSRPKRIHPFFRWLLVVAVVALGSLFVWQNRVWLNPQAIQVWISQFGAAGPFVYILLYAFNTIIILPPVGFLAVTAGLAFKPLVGFCAIVAGALLGSTVTFFLSRRLGQDMVEKRFGKLFKQMNEKLSQKGFLTILFFRIFPLVPYEVMNYVPGLSRVRFKDYFLGTFFGLFPGAAIAIFFGNSLARPFSLRFLATAAAAGAAVALAIVVPLLYLKLRKNYNTR